MPISYYAALRPSSPFNSDTVTPSIEISNGLSSTLPTMSNYTIDDTEGDLRTHDVPVFAPPNLWAGPSCNDHGCGIKPDPAQARENTWQAATYTGDQELSISFGYEGKCFSTHRACKPGSATRRLLGTDIYIYFILPNTILGGDGGNVTTLTECNFAIDNQPAGNFTHIPDPHKSDYLYDQLVFHQTFENRNHTVNITVSNDDGHHSFIAFDYATYT